MTVRDVAYFAAEMGVYAAVGVTGWRHHPAAGIAAVLAMAVWWGALHSPRAPIHLPAPSIRHSA